MTGSYFHLTNTIMKLLGLPLAIFISFSYKTSIYGKDSTVVSAINNSQKLSKISLRHLSPNKIKQNRQMPFLQSIKMNCQLSDISN